MIYLLLASFLWGTSFIAGKFAKGVFTEGKIAWKKRSGFEYSFSRKRGKAEQGTEKIYA